MAWLYLNGEILAEEDAAISVDDRGFLLGDGLFETMRAYGGVVFRLGAHLARLQGSAEFLRMNFNLAGDAVGKIVAELLERNACPDAYVRLTATRGPLEKGLRLDGPARPTTLIRVRPFAPYPEELYKRGARLILARARSNSASDLPRHKTLNYLPYLLAKQEAVDAGAFGAVMLNEQGQVAEESLSNLFIVRDGRLATPPVHCGLLPGITRAVVMKLFGRANGIPCEECVLSPGDLFGADECFLTNTLMEIMPVRSLDRRPIGRDVPGPLTVRLHELFREAVARETGRHAD